MKIRLGVVAIVLAMFLAAPATAMEFNHGGMGDALIYQYFDVNRGVNYVTVSNTTNQWVQFHIRFRTAVLCIEALDFDVIVSPNDVFVFAMNPVTRDVDIAGTTITNALTWEIDKTLDPNNFAYTRLTNKDLQNNYAMLAPQISSVYTQDHARVDLSRGYIEVIGECVLVGLGSYRTKAQLIAQGMTAYEYVNTHNRSLIDAPNCLAGTLFIPNPANGTGYAMNAVAIEDFRTDIGDFDGEYHRDGDQAHAEYPTLTTRGVILHNDDSADDTFGTRGNDVFNYNMYDVGLEQVVSYNNTWGPTLADGDDLNGVLDDVMDIFTGIINSVTEVEQVIADASSDSLYGHYFDTDAVESWFVITFVTKHHRFPMPFSTAGYDLRTTTGYQAYRNYCHGQSLAAGQILNAAVWDNDENPLSMPISAENISPYIPGAMTQLVLGFEVNLFNMGFLKSGATNADAFTEGMVYLGIVGTPGFDIPALSMMYEMSGSSANFARDLYFVDTPRCWDCP
jgi:hypothetical protein